LLLLLLPVVTNSYTTQCGFRIQCFIINSSAISWLSMLAGVTERQCSGSCGCTICQHWDRIQTNKFAAKLSPMAAEVGGQPLCLQGHVVSITLLLCMHLSNKNAQVCVTVAARWLRSPQALTAATAAPYLIALAAAAAGMCPTHLLGCMLLSLPAAKSLLDFAFANHTVPAQIAPLKKYGVRWHVAMGLSLVAGLLIS
jgi:hypothetical protein